MDFDTERVEARSVAFKDVDVSRDGWTFEGLAAVYDEDADLGDFTESVHRGAYRKAIPGSGNIPMLYHHNDMLPVLATTSGGTLTLGDDAKGLRVKADIAQHYVGEAVRELVKRGDIKGMSAGFIVGRGNSRVEHRGAKPHRSITAFKKILDVSPTWEPAYPGTTAELRSLRAVQMAQELVGVVGVGEVRRALAKTKREFRALATPQLQNTLQGLQSTAEAIEVALNNVGIGAEVDDPEGNQVVVAGPFTDEQYADALETIQALVEGAEGLLESAGSPDPDEAEDASEATSSTTPDTGTEQRSGVEATEYEVAAAARRRRLQVLGIALPRA